MKYWGHYGKWKKTDWETNVIWSFLQKKFILTFLHISKINGSLWSITEMKWFFYNKFESYMKI